MGWESRRGGRYLYRSRRVNGKPVKEYLAAANESFGFGDLMAHELDRLRRLEADLRRLRRANRAAYRGRLDDLLGATRVANDDLQQAAHAILEALGYHRHHRGEWRMKREQSVLKAKIADQRERAAGGPSPVLNYAAPTSDAEAAELFARARAGDAEAKGRLGALVRDRRWQGWLGDLGWQATRQLIVRASGGDPVWEAGLVVKADALRAELLGDESTVLEGLLVRRVVNGWVATHALELELAVRPPAEGRDRAHLDRALSRAQKRMTDAARELARVRLLKVLSAMGGISACP